MHRIGRTAVLLLASFALIAAGCGGKVDSAGGGSAPAAAGTDTAAATTVAAAASTEASPAGEVGDAAVASGLARMVTVAAEVAAKTATDAEAGKTAAAGLEPHWAPIEDRVKANDPDAYIAIEDAMAQLESGDATKAAAGAAALETTISAHVAAFPG
jgi:hypothetical protein